MEGILKKYKEKVPQIVFEWNDEETSAQGWLVINSLRNGAAGGGTRMRKGLTKSEVVSLAKVMEVKFAACGPEIGGAKSGINFDPNDPRKDEVLKRWFRDVLPLLKHYYGTGGDLNIDEIKDVIPITEDLGLWHPQEGVVNGFYKAGLGDNIHKLGHLRFGCVKLIEDADYAPDGKEKYAVADLITGFGVAESVRLYYDIWKGETLIDKKVVIQGWGNVGAAAGLFMAKYGAKIVGIIDISGGIIDTNGLGLDEIKALFKNRDGNRLKADNMLDFEEVNDEIWDIESDIFIPAAASKLITKDQAERMITNGTSVISCGANVPFVDDKIFFGETAKFVDSSISLIPDFLANSGMARVFAYLMNTNETISDKAIFEDVTNLFKANLTKVYLENSKKKTGISTKALELALKKLV